MGMKPDFPDSSSDLFSTSISDTFTSSGVKAASIFSVENELIICSNVVLLASNTESREEKSRHALVIKLQHQQVLLERFTFLADVVEDGSYLFFAVVVRIF